jgi:hypothetical protein
MDITTVEETKTNLVNKLVGLSTVATFDVNTFSIFEVKDIKGIQERRNRAKRGKRRESR